jgi:hypothetical protein
MSRLNLWTQEEIEKMKLNFLKGKSIKTMARELGRTPTALNKALSRFGIRHQIRKIPPTDTCKKIKLGTFYPNTERQGSVQRPHILWVNIMKVIDYLSKNGYAVKLCDKGQILLNSKLTPHTYLVMLANKLRQQENKPVFMVEEVTW